ncbi:PIN domain-containing protein [Acidianus infernus]|uniref:PIN domain-containing protein n=1 Tax=Acidianus infernus TaxID=12915 RepID=A0A6A9QHC2_ACIIN|nr:PIN domain-containing protein [Acidianus infernus]MCY0874603.1 PIN domain-containing protein [Acidianus infernus]MUM64566.1 PIN domain-containing protein [Acidianus infernus]
MGANKNLGILVDTNILLYVYDGVDPFNLIIEYLDYKPEFYIHKAVFHELEILRSRHSRSPSYMSRINIALIYLEKYKNYWKLIGNEIDKPTDDILIECAKRNKLLIFTNDKELKQKALKNNVGIIFLTSKGKIIKSLFPI